MLWKQKEDQEKFDGSKINPHINNLLSGNLQLKRVNITPEIPDRINFSVVVYLGLLHSSWRLDCGSIQMETHLFRIVKTVHFQMTDFWGMSHNVTMAFWKKAFWKDSLSCEPGLSKSGMAL